MKKAGIAVLALAVLAACGSGGKSAPPGYVKVNGASVAELKKLAEWGKCMKPWNDAVDEWNRLTAKRDASGAQTVVVDGKSFDTYPEWAAAHGKPVQTPNC